MTRPLCPRTLALLGTLSLMALTTSPLSAQDAAAKMKVRAASKASNSDVRPEHTSATVANAVMRGDMAALRALLATKTDVNVPQGDGMTALHWAADRGDVTMAQMLIKSGAKLTATTRVGNYTPLHVAAQQGRAGVVKILLAAGADPNARTIGGSTALHYAATSSSADAVSELLAAKADPNAREFEWGQTPLMYAADANRAGAITALLQGKADPNLETKAVDLTAMGAEDQAATKRRTEVMMAMLPQRVRDSLKTEADKLAAAAPVAGTPRAGRAGGAGAAGASGAAGAAAAVDPALAIAAGFARQRAPTVPTQYLTPVQIQEAITAGRAYADSVAKNPPAAKAASGGRGGAADTTTDGNGNLSQGAFATTVGGMGGLAALHHAVRQGNLEAAIALIEGGADINERTGSDSTTPLLMATINGQFDLAMELVKRGANVKLASTQNNTPLYSTINTQWAPRSRYPQPQAIQQQKTTYMEMMQALIKAGADVNVRLSKNLWYFGYSNCGNANCGLELLDGTTPFWRATYAVDLDAMKMLVAAGADVNIPSYKAPANAAAAGRGGRGGGAGGSDAAAAAAAALRGRAPTPPLEPAIDSASKAVPPGIGVYPIHAAAGVGYGNGFAGNAHRHAPDGWMPVMKYLVEVQHADVNQRDNNGYTPLHHAAARGDNEMILYLVSKGADPKAVARNGRTTVDMANGPVERLRPIPETIALLEKLGAHNSHRCVGC
jgi:ankyrin repeat protein